MFLGHDMKNIQLLNSSWIQMTGQTIFQVMTKDWQTGRLSADKLFQRDGLYTVNQQSSIIVYNELFTFLCAIQLQTSRRHG